MTNSQFLNPASAQFHGYASQARERAARAAKEMQAIVNEKIRNHGYADPDIEFLELIGKGAYGRVFKSKHLPTNQIVAVKIVDVDASDYEVNARDNDGAFHKFMNETSILKTLKERKARNVNLIHDAFTFDQDVWIISEYCPGGSVHTLMRASPDPGLSERYIIPIARELAEALRWVHSVGIIHRDIKAANILICEDGRVQLCDFGVSGMLEAHTNKRTTFIGTPQYMPLELLSAEEKSMRYPHMWVDRPRYGTDMDIWSYGCTLYEMAMGEPPNGRVQGIENIARALTQKTPRLEGPGFSPGLRDLVAQCLTESPEDRPTIEEVQQHPCLVNSAITYPTESLKDLLEEYYFWERSGGQRVSLFMAGGAAVSSQPVPEPEELDSWEFSSTESFGREVENKRASVMSMNKPYGTHDSPPSISISRSESSHRGGIETPTAGEHPRIPPNPLLRLFDQSDDYNYLDRGQIKPQDAMAAPPDLPLREHSNDSALRVSMIDLGDFDASTGTATIPTLKTIRGPRNTNPHFQGLDYDEEDLDDDEHRTYKPIEDGGEKRATKDWKFPSFGGAAAEDHRKKRATKDWKFPGLSETAEDPNTKRATKDWKFPGLVTPSNTTDRASRSGYLNDAWSFPSIIEAQDEDASRRGSVSQKHDSAGLRALQESVSAPVSPPHPTIDLGEYLPARPSTADSSANPLSPGVDPDNPFGSPEAAYHDPSMINNPPHSSSNTNNNNLLGSRFSFHKQSRSEPASLDAPTTSSTTNASTAATATTSTYDLSPEHPDSATLDAALDSDGSDISDETRRKIHDHNAKQKWKESFYNDWKDVSLFNPVTKDPKQGAYHSRNKRSDDRHQGRNQSRTHHRSGGGSHVRGSSSRSKDVNGENTSGPVRVGGSGNSISGTHTLSRSAGGNTHKYSFSHASSNSISSLSRHQYSYSDAADADTSDLEADDALTRAVRSLNPHSAESTLSGLLSGNSIGQLEGDVDLSEVETYVGGSEQPMPPTAAVLAEGAPSEVVMEELERLLGEWTGGLGVVQRALFGSHASARERSLLNESEG